MCTMFNFYYGVAQIITSTLSIYLPIQSGDRYGMPEKVNVCLEELGFRLLLSIYIYLSIYKVSHKKSPLAVF